MPGLRKLFQITAIRYLTVGCSSYVLELSLLLALMHFGGMKATMATAIAYWAGLLMAFGLQKVVAFKDYRRELRVLTKQGLGFALLTIWNWVFTVWFVGLWSDESIAVTRSVALVIMSAWNYALYKYVLFKQPSGDESDSDKGSWWHRLYSDTLLRWSIGLVAGWRLILELLNQYIGQPVAQASSFLANLTNWSNWDGDWYASINQYGYGMFAPPDRQANVAFFPGFPESVNVLGYVLPLQHLYIGLLLNIILTIASTYLLMKLACLLAGRFGIKTPRQQRTIALLSAAGLLAFPSSFFMAAYYAEALLVLGFVGSVYFALRGRLWLAVPFMIMASASKVTGSLAVATVAVIVLEQWLRERQKPGAFWLLIKRWLIVALGAAGLIGYALYLHIVHHDGLLFYHIEAVWGRHVDGFFVTNIAGGYYAHFLDRAHFGSLYNFLMIHLLMVLPFLVFAAGLVIAKVFRTFWPLVLGLLVIVIPLSTGLIEGINRYCLVLAPVIPYIFIWLHGKVRPMVLYVVLAVGFWAMLGFAWGFLDGRYFAG